MKTYIISGGASVPALINDLRPKPDSTNFRFPVGRGVTANGLNLRVSMPAVFDEDFAFTLDERGVVLFGKRREPAEFGNVRRFALRYGNFEQRIALPSRLDTTNVTARFHHGVLDIHFSFAPVTAPLKIPLQRRAEEFAAACATS